MSIKHLLEWALRKRVVLRLPQTDGGNEVRCGWKWCQVTFDLSGERSGGGDCHITTAHWHSHIKLSSETEEQVAAQSSEISTLIPRETVRAPSLQRVYIIVCVSERNCALDFISVASTVKMSRDGAIQWRVEWWRTRIRACVCVCVIHERPIKHTHWTSPENLIQSSLKSSWNSSLLL